MGKNNNKGRNQKEPVSFGTTSKGLHTLIGVPNEERSEEDRKHI